MTVRSPLFFALWKWAKGQDENFMTESLGIVLRALKQTDPTAAHAILLQLFGTCAPSMQDVRELSVVTQTMRSLGTTDIELACSDFHLILEAKVEAPVDEDQLARYRQELDSMTKVGKRFLVLLTALEPNQAGPLGVDLWTRWQNVGQALKAVHSAIRDSHTSALVADFIHFLGARGLVMAKLTQPLAETLANLFAFMGLMKEALKSAKLPASPTWAYSESRQYVGYYIDGKNFWFGASTRYPDELRFTTDHLKLREQLSIEGRTEADRFTKGVWSRSLMLDNEFSKLERPNQLTCIKDWLTSTWTFAQRLKTANEQP